MTFTQGDLTAALADWAAMREQYQDSEFPDSVDVAGIAEKYLPRALAALEEAWADRDKLLELVADLVSQGCTTRREGDKSVLHHSFISVYEEAFDVLEDAGLLKDIGREEYQWQNRAAEEKE